MLWINRTAKQKQRHCFIQGIELVEKIETSEILRDSNKQLCYTNNCTEMQIITQSHFIQTGAHRNKLLFVKKKKKIVENLFYFYFLNFFVTILFFFFEFFLDYFFFFFFFFALCFNVLFTARSKQYVIYNHSLLLYVLF